MRNKVRMYVARLRAKWYSTKPGKRQAVKRYRKKYNSKEWPLEYTGPMLRGKVDGVVWTLETGQPLRKIPGLKVSQGGGVYMSPDGVERTIPRKRVAQRTD